MANEKDANQTANATSTTTVAVNQTQVVTKQAIANQTAAAPVSAPALLKSTNSKGSIDLIQKHKNQTNSSYPEIQEEEDDQDAETEEDIVESEEEQDKDFEAAEK